MRASSFCFLRPWRSSRGACAGAVPTMRGRWSAGSEIVISELRAVHEFDYAVVNDELESAVAAVCEIVHAERSGETVSVEERFGRPRVVSLLSDRFDFGV